MTDTPQVTRPLIADTPAPLARIGDRAISRAAFLADAQALADILAALFADPAERRRLGEAGRAVVEANRGALARTLEGLTRLLPPK